jgi:hypothetical protein
MTITERLSDWYWNLSLGKRRVVRVLIWMVVLSIPVYVFFMPLEKVWAKTPIADDSPRARAASELFWEVFHAGDVSRSQEAIDSMTAAYAALPEPGVVLTSMLAGAHLWRFSVRNTLQLSDPQVRAELEAATRYGSRAVQLTQGVAETTAPSILAMAEWLLFVADGQQDSLPRVHADILENSILWPPFHGFMQGWLLAPMYAGDSYFYPTANVGYRFMLDVCAGFKLPQVLHFTKIAHTLYGLKSIPQPVCYNNPIAPHSIEGTLMSIADTYLKAGDLQNAELWYNNAKTSPTYSTWRYQGIVDNRLANLAALRDKFNADTGVLDVTEPAMTLQSDMACGMCHYAR